MFGGLILVLAATLVANASPQTLFAVCPDTYRTYCYHGTCRFLVSEWVASCMCFKGYVGIRCQYVDLLQVMAGDPRSFTVVALAVTFLVVLSLICSTCLGIYLCKMKRARSRLTLLENMHVQDV
ncbi:hypothetical protein FKM82_015258 [Ascaphus truei]|uniref:protransforming growth factor alpha-like isoform X2 n=1 Tax=Ascaphus truei TaxID=8439 RepID=UPI003F59CE06